MMRRSPLNSGTKALRRKTPMRQVGFARASSNIPPADVGLKRAAVTANHAREPKLPRLSKPMRSRGMKGRPPTAEEARFMDRMGKLPCIACLKDGWTNHEISLHHIDGRTKPDAHRQILPLCAPHHQQDDTDPRGRISLHGRKATFQARYGTERELLAECVAMIEANIPARVDAGANVEKITTEL